MSNWPAGYGLLELTEVDSTNAEGLRRAGAGNMPLWITATRQSAGRGRRGNVWQSDGGNLFASLLLRPARKSWADLSFLAALAVSDALARLAPTVSLSLKWPNDVLAEGRKISGILLEPEVRAGALVVGIGINLASFPPHTSYGATSLSALGLVPPAPRDALLELAAAWDKLYRTWQADGFAPIRELWLSRAAGLGGPITVRLPSGMRSGMAVMGSEQNGLFTGLDESGALLLAVGGITHKIAAGDVFLL